jgi:tRNA-Thr(GGU) m(6)t(6)A37 methyltransferase TsaA
MEQAIVYKPIGIIRTPFKDISDMPVQPCGAIGVEGVVELYPEFSAGLIDVEGFSHLILLYHFHLIKGYKLYVVPFMDDKPHGIFATRAPTRPNAIGMSTVLLKKIVNNQLFIDGVDMIDGTPLIDVKPFFPKYDNQDNVKYGWLESKHDIDITKIKSDARFDSKKSPELNRCK